MGVFEKIKNGLKKTRESFSSGLNQVLKSFQKIDEDFFLDLEEMLITADCGVATTEHILELLREKVKKEGISEPEQVKGALKEIMREILSCDEELKLQTSPSVLLVIGVNGVGKTTSIGKIAALMKAQGKKVIIGAADTFRAAAVEQLEIWSQRTGVPMIRHQEGADPAAVVYDTVVAAKSRHCDLAICDTAGRLHNNKNLMEELSKIVKVMNRELPDSDKEILLVIDATTGRNAVIQARNFKDAAHITGIILTKLDGTAKGGVVLSVVDELHVPVKLVGVGEQVDDLQPFDADAFVEGLFA